MSKLRLLWLKIRFECFWRGMCSLATSTKSVANRFERQFKIRATEFTIIQRDTSAPDMYSREEVYGMLRTVRNEEKRMNWKCPEPE